MKIYYFQKDQQFLGPFTLDEMRDQALAEHDMVWKDGTADWVPASTLEELACMFRPQSLTSTSDSIVAGKQFAAKPSKWLLQLAVLAGFLTSGDTGKQYA
jgi:acyl carrier protein phosphodiesterase